KEGPKQLLQVLERTRADLLIAGGRNQYTALKARIPFLDINQERHHAYAGYRGLLTLARELDAALYSPIWEQVRRPAPWDVDSSSSGDWDPTDRSPRHKPEVT
ncbi:MAG: nitrogenase component 1, partial [Thermostichus sp. BF3_bins_97]